MGYDLSGSEGQYFRANIWSWPVIAEMVMETGLIEYPIDIYMNNGDFISGDQAQRIADYIDTKLRDNAGIKDFVLRADASMMYRTDRDHIEKFVAFCRSCKNGFRIW